MASARERNCAPELLSDQYGNLAGFGRRSPRSQLGGKSPACIWKSSSLRIQSTETLLHEKCSQPRSTSAGFVGIFFDHGLGRCQCFDAAARLIRRHTRSMPFQILARYARRAGAILPVWKWGGRAIAVRNLAAWIGVITTCTTRISQGDGQSQNGECDSCAVHVSASCLLEGWLLVGSRSQVVSVEHLRQGWGTGGGGSRGAGASKPGWWGGMPVICS
jgi:hypothetical protein